MIKLYLHLHNATLIFKKQFLHTAIFLFAICIGSSAKAQCDVNPVANQNLCNNTATTAIQFTGTATSYNWTNNTPAIGLAASGTGDIASFRAVNPSTTTVTATITVTPVSASCTGTPISFTITVKPSPRVVVTPNTTCGGPCNSMTASGADSYIWSPITGLYLDCATMLAYTGGNVSTVYTQPSAAHTSYTVVGTNLSTGCSSQITAWPNYVPPAPAVVPNSVFMCLGDPAAQLTVVKGTGSVRLCTGTLLSIAVPDNDPAGVLSDIQVANMPAACTVTGVRVSINMSHTRMGNMVFVLKAPNGQVINLDYHLSGTGGTGTTTGFTNTIFSSSGTLPLSSGVNPYTATFKADLVNGPSGGYGAAGPTGMLPSTTNWNSLFATGVNGTWTLGFYDGVTGDIGILHSWCLFFDYACPANLPPTTPAVWTPAAGLFIDPAATAPYVGGTGRDVIYARPTPAGVYTYQVTTTGVPAPLCAPTTNFVNNNTAGLLTFNVKNNHAFPIRLFQINSRTANAVPTAVNVYYKAAAINGSPGSITAANGWNRIGVAGIDGTATGVQTFITNLSLVIPAGATYGICLQANDINNAPNLAYSSLIADIYSFNDNGCELITGTDIGYSGNTISPGPTTALSGFIGSIQFAQAVVSCQSTPTSVVVNVSQFAAITAHPINRTVCAGSSAGFTVTVTGSGSLTYQWQVATAANGPWTNIANSGVYSGVNTGTLLISSTTVTMNGNYYRVVVNGGSGCSGATSFPALLMVNATPVVTLSANPLLIGPGEKTVIRSVVTPNPAAVYTWYFNGSILVGANADTVVVDLSGLGDYQLKITDINGCTSALSNIITIAHSFSSNLLTYPNPSGGLFQLKYFSEINTIEQRSLFIYNNRGERILTRNFTQSIPYQKIDVDIRANGKGLYWVELRDANGKRLALNRVVVQ